MPIKIYRIKEVCEITGLRPSSIYKQIRLNLFPQGVKLTARSTGWPSDVIDAWLKSRIAGERL
ncbi:helix-turn-helix transcriptional regulator [Polynucleobacter difficilis]|jgi:predicted DNA-binding transcriptional regulator AlpA|uniref:helix-turn-helix transcriptional regulator n=1 Tax=Polynucleobacter difficilis TaxID=556054 RepID=UPI000D3BE299